MFPLRDTIPSRRPPVMMWAIILANCFVFVVELGLPPPARERLFYWFGVVPARYLEASGQVCGDASALCLWPLLTHMFLHAGWLHIIGNMWTLWIFGDNVEDRLGSGRFLVFYLLCGLGAALVHMLTNAGSTVPTVGASGAISGVLAAYLLLYPFARVIVLVPVLFWPFFFELPALVYMGLWFWLQFFSGTLALVAPQSGGGVAWWAHIGGFGAGLVLCPLFLLGRPRPRLYRDQYGMEGAWGGRHRPTLRSPAAVRTKPPEVW